MNRIRADLHQVELDIDEMLGEIDRLKKENEKKDQEIEALKKENKELRKGKSDVKAESAESSRKFEKSAESQRSPEPSEKSPRVKTERKTSKSPRRTPETYEITTTTTTVTEGHESSRKSPEGGKTERYTSSSSSSSTSSSSTTSRDLVVNTTSLGPSNTASTTSLSPSSVRGKYVPSRESLNPTYLEETTMKIYQGKSRSESVSESGGGPGYQFYPEGDGKNPPASPTRSPAAGFMTAKVGKDGEVEEETTVASSSSSSAEASVPRNVVVFNTGETASTIFLDFAITKDIWRCDLRFFHDEAHINESADFGIVNSANVNNFVDKWLYNNVDTCVYLLDRTNARICVGLTPKPLLHGFDVRSGTEVAAEIDFEIKEIRFYNRLQPVPFSIRIPFPSVHVGLTGRWQQRLELIGMRRVEKATLRKGVAKLPVIDWVTE